MIKKLKAYNRIIVIFLMIVSLFIILLNKGQFNYSIWNSHFEIEYKDESQLEKLKNLENIAFINAQDKNINLQNTSFERITEQIKNTDEQLLKDIEISFVEGEEIQSDSQQIFLFTFFSIIFYSIGIYYFVFRFIKQNKTKRFVLNFFTIVLSTFLGSIYLLALLFVLSRFYLIKQIDLNVITVYVISLLFFNFYINSKQTDVEVETKEFLKEHISSLKNISGYVLLINLTTIGLLNFALGKNFVILSLLFVVAVYSAIILQNFSLNSIKYFIQRKEFSTKDHKETKVIKATQKYINKGPKRKHKKSKRKG